MYTKKEIEKALKLYERLGSMNKVTFLLGYPSRKTLRGWLAEKKQTGKVIPKNGAGRKGLLPLEDKKKAAKIYLHHGGNRALTCKKLGISVTSRTLQRWCNRFFPKKKKVCFSNAKAGSYSIDIKSQAVLAMRQRGRTVISVAREFGVSRPTLYAWEQELAILTNLEGGQRMAQRKKKDTSYVASAEKPKLDKALAKIADLERQVTFLASESDLLQKQILQLKLQKDVLVKAAELIKKDEGINLEMMSNKEKAK